MQQSLALSSLPGLLPLRSSWALLLSLLQSLSSELGEKPLEFKLLQASSSLYIPCPRPKQKPADAGFNTLVLLHLTKAQHRSIGPSVISPEAEKRFRNINKTGWKRPLKRKVISLKALNPWTKSTSTSIQDRIRSNCTLCNVPLSLGQLIPSVTEYIKCSFVGGSSFSDKAQQRPSWFLAQGSPPRMERPLI